MYTHALPHNSLTNSTKMSGSQNYFKTAPPPPLMIFHRILTPLIQDLEIKITV